MSRETLCMMALGVKWPALSVLVFASTTVLASSTSAHTNLIGATPSADRIVIEKSHHRLTTYSSGKVLNIYRVSLGPYPKGPKERQGDGRTPEGLYTIDARKPDSGFHLALHISYPSVTDRARAAALRVDPGGDIMIHGLKNGLGWIGSFHHFKDWTNGCIAVTNAEMDELWKSVPVGTVVEIRP